MKKIIIGILILLLTACGSIKVSEKNYILININIKSTDSENVISGQANIINSSEDTYYVKFAKFNLYDKDGNLVKQQEVQIDKKILTGEQLEITKDIDIKGINYSSYSIVLYEKDNTVIEELLYEGEDITNYITNIELVDKSINLILENKGEDKKEIKFIKIVVMNSTQSESSYIVKRIDLCLPPNTTKKISIKTDYEKIQNFQVINLKLTAK